MCRKWGGVKASWRRLKARKSLSKAYGRKVSQAENAFEGLGVNKQQLLVCLDLVENVE